MRQIVGIDRKIKRAWLDALLDQLANTHDEGTLRAFLDQLLKDELPATSSRAKTAGILLRIWRCIPADRIPLRDRAVALLPRITGAERIWLHWGMTALAYPFFRDTVEVVGRLLALQDDLTSGQIQSRLLTTWGDRSTSKEAAQKLVNTLVDWEVLRVPKTRGHFLPARKQQASLTELELWLMEAWLQSSSADEIEAQQLLRLPGMFPFTINAGVGDLRRHFRFDLHRQGLDMDMVALVKVRPVPVVKTPRIRKAKSTPATKTVPATKTTSVAKSPEKSPDKVMVTAAIGKSATDPTTVSSLPVPAKPATRKPPAKTAKKGAEGTIVDVTPAAGVWRQLAFPPETLGMTEAATATATAASATAPADISVGAIRIPAAKPDRCDPFAAPLFECAEHFRRSHYFGCIALAQSLVEGVVQYLSVATFKKKRDRRSSFESTVSALHKQQVLSDDWKSRIEQMWSTRHHFHEWNPVRSVDRQQLEAMATETMTLANDLDREFVIKVSSNALKSQAD